MRRDEEDEVQVLGTAPKNGGRKALWRLIAIATGVLLIVLCVIYLSVNKEEVTSESLLEIPASIQQENPLPADSLPEVRAQADSINDVVLTIFALKNLKAELAMQMPEQTDTSVYFVLQAADIRKDNKQIVGDFVLRGKQLSRGKRKTGYCAIIQGNITLGNTINDDMKAYSIANGCDFFRQYPLVMNGEIQENRLKGKAIRRALAQQNQDFYIIETQNRESMYDFSEALCDMGFTNALYLVGGSSYAWWREDAATVNELGVYNQNPLPNTNYLVFRAMKIN